MTVGDEGPIRVGLIGFGLAGAVFHAPTLVAAGSFSLGAVVTSDPGRRARAEAAYPGVRVVATAEELWALAGQLDLVVVASANRTHVPFATAALEAGLAVVVDKPFAATAAEALALAELAEQRGLLLSVYQNRRWDGDFLTLRSLLERSELGRVWRFESRFERWKPQLKGDWRESPDPAQFTGALYDFGSHLVDQALVLFGPPMSVYAEVLVRRPGAGTDDDSFIAMEHAGGVRTHLWMSLTAADHGPRFRVLGSEGAFVKYGLDLQEDALKRGERPGPGWGEEPEENWGLLTGAGGRPRPVPTVPGDYVAYYRAVAGALRTSAPPPVSAREAARAIAVLEAARLSAREGRTVEPGYRLTKEK